ncbi:MAG: BNR repeat-containing protein [Muribaculaceae bacterium]|nr:BNR repeat-containing protein [Muribaculaceae bacterium]
MLINDIITKIRSLLSANSSGKKIHARLIKVGKGYARTSVNTSIFRKSSLATHGSTQYIAYYDGDGNIVLGKRNLGSRHWSLVTLPYKGKVADAHNVISIGVDGNGFIHMAFDMHGHPLKYTKSTKSGSLEMMSLQSTDGVEDESVTYPEFYSLPDGDLLLAYRSGRSGNGSMVLKKYTTASKQWHTLHNNLIDGQLQRNAYWQMIVDAKGRIHLSWVWRETADVATNHDVCYAWSDDGGISWKKTDGSTYALPITIENAEVAWQVPQNVELINQTSIAADSEGHPYIATYWRDLDSEVPQYRTVMHDGTMWRSYQVGERKIPFSLKGKGTKMVPISRPCILIDNSLIYYIFRDIERGSRISVAITDNIDKGFQKIIDISTVSVDAWEPTLDINLWNKSKKLHLFVQATHQGDGEKLSSHDKKNSIVYVMELITNHSDNTL